MRAPHRRYVVLETLRAFGAEQLAADGQSDAVHDRHAGHHVEWLEATERRMIDPRGASITEIDAALSELRSALGWLLHRGRVEEAGRLVTAVYTYAILRLRPDVLAWAERVIDADPDDRSPLAAVVWAVSSSAAWMAGDLTATAVRSDRARRVAERAGGPIPAAVARTVANTALFEGNLQEAVGWYRSSLDAAAGDRAQWLMAASTQLLARAYAGDPGVVEAAAELLAAVGDDATPYAAYAWYCAGEAILSADVEGAQRRLERGLELAESTDASFVVGIAGASRTSIEARFGDPLAAAEEYRRLLSHWRRAGMWSTQWTMLRSVAGLLARLRRHRDAAVLLGAVQATAEGHRIFGADEAALAELGAMLRAALGDDAYEAALSAGAVLDGDAAVEHALDAL
jgi:tetratricopeptide (TPR) repeat protein